jgi:uncharacterized protein (TIGR03435 family)
MSMFTKLCIACLFALFTIMVVTAQTPMSFQAVSVKPNHSGEQNARISGQPGGQMTATNVPLRSLISAAYQVPDFQIVGGPSWVDSDRFDVTAKAAGDPNPQQFQLMLQSALAQRFKLRVHREIAEVPVYALVLAASDGKPGPHLGTSGIDCEELARANKPPPPLPATVASQNRPISVCSTRIGNGVLAARSTTMPRFATNLSAIVDRMVLDKTGLTGSFDIDLEWTPDPAGSGADPSLLVALHEQLALKLELARGPVEVLVIDSADQPTPD